MTVMLVQLVAPQQVPAADTVVYTAPALTTAKIGRATFTNTTGTAATITAAITTGGATAAANTIISALTVAPGQCYVSPELAGAVIPAASVLRLTAGTANAITAMVSGITSA